MKSTPAGADAQYQAALNEGRFWIQRCGDCAKHIFFPRQICPHCGSASLAWIEPRGTGTVHSTSVVRRKPDSGGDYNVALIDLDEGARMMSRVEGIAPAEVKIGMRVKVKVINDKGNSLVVFERADSAQQAR